MLHVDEREVWEESARWMCTWETSVCDWRYCVPEGSVIFAQHSPPGLLTRSTARTLADGECWQGPGPRCCTPAASRQSSTQLQGGFLGHTHLTRVAGRQVNLKHTAGAIRNTCRDTPTTHADRLWGGQVSQWYNSFWSWCDFSRPVVVKMECGIPSGGNRRKEMLGELWGTLYFTMR